MPNVLAMLLSGLISIAATVAGRVMLALGFGFVEYVGISALVDKVMQELNGGLSGAFAGYPLMQDWAGFLRIDVHFTLIASAIGVKLIFNGLQGGSVRKLVQK